MIDRFARIRALYDALDAKDGERNAVRGKARQAIKNKLNALGYVEMRAMLTEIEKMELPQ